MLWFSPSRRMLFAPSLSAADQWVAAAGHLETEGHHVAVGIQGTVYCPHEFIQFNHRKQGLRTIMRIKNYPWNGRNHMMWSSTSPKMNSKAIIQFSHSRPRILGGSLFPNQPHGLRRIRPRNLEKVSEEKEFQQSRAKTVTESQASMCCF